MFLLYWNCGIASTTITTSTTTTTTTTITYHHCDNNWTCLNLCLSQIELTMENLSGSFIYTAHSIYSSSATIHHVFGILRFFSCYFLLLYRILLLILMLLMLNMYINEHDANAIQIHTHSHTEFTEETQRKKTRTQTSSVSCFIELCPITLSIING